MGNMQGMIKDPKCKGNDHRARAIEATIFQARDVNQRDRQSQRAVANAN